MNTGRFAFDGQPHQDTNNDAGASEPAPGDWRGILLEKYSNDRNVVVVSETEGSFTNANDRNGTPADAQFLGELAANEKSGDENLALGYTLNGFIAIDDPTDVDVYSFKAPVGTEDRLFGSVTNQDIADAIFQARKVRVDKHDIELEEPIKTVGTHMVKIRVHSSVDPAEVKVIVAPEEDEA